MSDRTLFPLPPADGHLTDRQQLAYNTLRETPEGATATQIGHFLHMGNGCAYCTQTPCKYAKTSGLEVLRALKKRGLVVQKKGGNWQASGQSQREPEGDPFPEGF